MGLHRTLAVALFFNLGWLGSSASSQPSAKEDPWLFKPVRIGLCIGAGPGCYLAGVKAEVSGRFVGVQANVGPYLAWAGFGAKVYPGVSIHRETWSLRPYLQGGRGAGFGFVGGTTPATGGGVGVDVHLRRGKRLLLQPQISVVGPRYSDCLVEESLEPDEQGAVAPPSMPPFCPEGQDEIVHPTSLGGSLAIMFAF